MRELNASVLEWYLGALDQGGYLPVAALMAMESSIVPLPSEFVIPPAVCLAHAHGHTPLAGIVIAGATGSWVGASVMYWASRLLGPPLLMRSGRLGTMGAFISQLLPVIGAHSHLFVRRHVRR